MAEEAKRDLSAEEVAGLISEMQNSIRKMPIRLYVDIGFATEKNLARAFSLLRPSDQEQLLREQVVRLVLSYEYGPGFADIVMEREDFREVLKLKKPSAVE